MTDTHDNQYSDELLNAFVDDELTAEDKERIYRALAQDADLRQQVDALRRLKDLTRTAFQSVLMHSERYPRIPRSLARRVATPLAASLAVLALGAVIGYSVATRLYSPTANGPVASAAAHTVRVLFDVSRDDPQAFRNALDQAEMLLATGTTPEPVYVRVIAHLGGLKLLSVDTVFAERIRQLQAAFPGRLVFFACNTTKRQWANTGRTVELLPEVVLVELGIQEVVRSEQQGWTHIQI